MVQKLHVGVQFMHCFLQKFKTNPVGSARMVVVITGTMDRRHAPENLNFMVFAIQ